MGLGLGKGRIAHNVGKVVRKEREYDGQLLPIGKIVCDGTDTQGHVYILTSKKWNLTSWPLELCIN